MNIPYSFSQYFIFGFFIIVAVLYPFVYLMLRSYKRRLQMLVTDTTDESRQTVSFTPNSNSYQSKILYRYTSSWFSVPAVVPATLRLQNGRISLIVDGNMFEKYKKPVVFDVALGDITTVTISADDMVIKTKQGKYHVWTNYHYPYGIYGRGLGFGSVTNYTIPNADTVIAQWYHILKHTLPTDSVRTAVGFWPDVQQP